MDWVKLSTRYYSDPAVMALPDEAAELAFIRSLAYCGAEETGGFIPEHVVPSFFRRRRYSAAVRAIQAQGLWEFVTDDRGQPGYRICRWDDWQAELDAIAQRRAADRDRKRRKRAEQKAVESRRYGTSCRWCGAREHLIVDHIVPLSRGGTDVESNKQMLCWSCNARKNNMTEEEYEAWLAKKGWPEPNPIPANKLSADTSADSPRTVRPIEKESEKNPPYPPQSGGTRPTRCTRHKARPKPWCDDCQKPAAVRPDSKTLTEALADPACPHGAPHGVACALCRRGIPAEDTA